MAGATDVVDMTGLKGRYQVDLQVSMADFMALINGLDRPGPAAIQDAQFQAVQEVFKRFGLRLEPRSGPVEMIVIDHLNRTPTEN